MRGPPALCDRAAIRGPTSEQHSWLVFRKGSGLCSGMEPNHGLISSLILFPPPRVSRSLSLVVCCLTMLTGAERDLATAAELRAALGKIDITPTQPVRMGGYESRKDPSRGVHDPLGARTLVLENSGQRLVLVSIDVLGFYNGTAEPLRQAILEECHLKPSELFLCAIHTHSAPILTLDAQKGDPNNVQYTKSLKDRLVELVRAALKNAGPVRATVCFGSSPVGVNRREVVQENATTSKVLLGRNPLKMTDREVQVLKLIRFGEDKLVGAIFAYSTHSTSLGPKNYLISGDIHGTAEQFLEHYYGNGMVAPGFAGASGNIDPWVRVLPDFRTNNGWIPETVLMGTMLGEEVARVLEGTQVPLTNYAIRTLFKTISLPAKQPSDTASQASTNSTAAINITVGCLGEIAFVGWGGEVFNEIGLAVKKGSPFSHTFILTHCNGAAGYLPDRESYNDGGYEVQSSRFGSGAAEALAEETLQMLRALNDN